MGAITLYQKTVRKQNGGWQSPSTISGADYISNGNNAHVIYSAIVDMSGSSAMTALNVSTNFVCNSNGHSHTATLQCFVYDTDPTLTNPSSPPSGYIASQQYAVTVPYYGLYQTFYITGLNITESKTLYLWFTDINASAYTDYLYSTPTGNEYTQNPSASGTFTAATQTLTISPESVTTGGTLSVTIANADSSMTAVFKYGNTTLGTATITNGAGTVTCPKTWFDTAGIKTLKTLPVAITISGTTLADNFDLVAGDDCKPVLSTPTASIVQPAAVQTYFPTTYIANITKAKIAASVTLQTASEVDSVVVSYTGGTSFSATYSATSGEYEATTPSPLTENTRFTVTVTDKRGMSSSKTVLVTGVVPYTEPSVTVSEIYRCDSSGTETSGGTYFRIKVTANYYHSGSLSTNTLLKLACKVSGTSAETNLTDGVLSSAISGLTDSQKRYKIIVMIQDRISSEISREVSLEGIARNFVIKRDQYGTHVGIGMTPEELGGACTLELPSGAVIYIGGEPIGSAGYLQVQADWEETDSTDVSFIRNKPTIPSNAEDSSNKVDTITGTGSSTQYTSTKCVYDLVGDIESVLEALL